VLEYPTALFERSEQRGLFESLKPFEF
jgi:hypothetical protein